jgi:hypothetical protein
MQLLNGPKEKRRHWKLKEEALDRTRFGKGYGPTDYRMNKHRGTPTYKTVYRSQDKEAAGCAGRLLQYCQLPHKNSHDITADICNLSRCLKMFMYLFQDFSQHPYCCAKHIWGTPSPPAPHVQGSKAESRAVAMTVSDASCSHRTVLLH